jgi:cytochrome c oxidase subunit 3
MTILLLFVAVLATIAIWWLSRQRLTAKPWLEEGAVDQFPGTGAARVPAAKIGLGVFLAVVGSLFALFASAYSMRMHMGSDWQSLPTPWLLWVNTGVLIASSVALQWTQAAARRGRIESVRTGLTAGAAATLLFLTGQVTVWNQLIDRGYFLASNPANSFFYLITVVHGLHLTGGLVALGRTAAKVRRGAGPAEVHLSIELCTMYWHFLLLVWLFVFALLLQT